MKPWPYLALALLARAAAEPLFQAGIPCTDDAAFHLFRAVELGRLVEAGHWFPRWAPDMALGYGYPFFNFYAPLSSYGVVLLHLAGLAYPAALKLGFILTLWLAGAAAYMFVSELWGAAAGLAAGAAYLFAPYLAYDVLFRGNLAEAAGFVWVPVVLWGITRVGRAGADEGAEGYKGSKGRSARGAAGVVAVGFAALILTHNIFAFIAAPLFVGYAVLAAWRAGAGWRRVLAKCAVGLGLGAALTTYFWAPAILERGLVHSDRLFVAPIFTWYTNFISARDLLALPRVDDPLLMNPSPARAIGLAPALLALPAVAAALFKIVGTWMSGGRGASIARDDRSFLILFFSLALVGYGLLTLEVSAPIWRLIGPLALVQFPWRMLGPASLCAALLIGASTAWAAEWFTRRRGQARAGLAGGLALVGVLGLVYFGNLGWWYPRACPAPASAGVADLVQFEIDSNTIGTTAKGEYLPLTASGVPADHALAEALLRGEEPARLALPEGASVTSANAGDPLDASYEVQAAGAVTATYQQFDYPGWRVSIDGAPADTRPDPATGLITFELPAGAHAVRVTFGLTPSRAAAVAVSLISLLALAAGGARALRRARRERAERGAAVTTAAIEGCAGWPAVVAVLAACALLPLARVAVIDRYPNPLRQTRFDAASGGPAPGARLGQQPLPLDFAGGMRLLGYDLSTTRLPADSALDAALYLARTQPNQERYWPAFFIEDAAGYAWQDPDYLPPRWQREPPATPLWPLDQYAQWARHLSLSPGTPPGSYTLWGQVFDLDSQSIASVLDSTGNLVAPRFELGELTVTRPARPFQLAPPIAAPFDLGPLRLLGYGLDRAALNAGDTLLLTLDWQSAAATDNDLLARVSFTDAAGGPGFEVEIEPANGYPTSKWRPGDEWRGQARVRIPATLPAGDYDLSVSLPGQGAGSARLGRVQVSAPARSFEAPPMATASGAEFAGVGVLAGYTLTRTAEALLVNLIWQATATPFDSYSVFIHLQADNGGRIWAQSDAGPANWLRPTTGWVAGEYVADLHSLPLPADLPAGSYTLWAGLYEPRRAARVPVSGPGAAADQRVALGQIRLP